MANWVLQCALIQEGSAQFRFITDSNIAYEKEKREEDRLRCRHFLELTEVRIALVQRAQPTSGSDLEPHHLRRFRSCRALIN
jgi:hypothetical protein